MRPCYKRTMVKLFFFKTISLPKIPKCNSFRLLLKQRSMSLFTLFVLHVFLSNTIHPAPTAGPSGKLCKRNKATTTKDLSCISLSSFAHATVSAFYGLFEKKTQTHLNSLDLNTWLFFRFHFPWSVLSVSLFTERARTRATMCSRSRRSPFPFPKCRQVKRRRLGKPEERLFERKGVTSHSRLTVLLKLDTNQTTQLVVFQCIVFYCLHVPSLALSYSWRDWRTGYSVYLTVIMARLLFTNSATMHHSSRGENAV